LRGLGLDLQLEIHDQPAVTPRITSGNYQFNVTQWTTHQTPEDFYLWFHSSNPTSVAQGWKGSAEGAQLDNLLDRAKASLEVDERASLIKQADELINLKAFLAWPLYYNLSVQAYRDYVQGVRFPVDDPQACCDQTYTWLSK
jgi:ABC-type oligopeptide transport system substrate-binding subunit